jgi:hypothetical protein
MRGIKVAVLGAALLTVSSVVAQLGTTFGGAPQSSQSPFGDKTRNKELAIPPAVQEQLEKGRQTERQKKLIADTDRLLALANELKTDMDKTTKDEMSIQVIHKAEEIEKLARSVKERMKG